MIKASSCPRPFCVASLRGWKPLFAGLGYLAAAVVLCCEPAKVDGDSLAFWMSSAAAKEGNNGNGGGGNERQGVRQHRWQGGQQGF